MDLGIPSPNPSPLPNPSPSPNPSSPPNPRPFLNATGGDGAEQEDTPQPLSLPSSGNGGRVNWSFWETLVLLDAKRKEPPLPQGSAGQVRQRWDGIAAYCASKGVCKSSTQCWHRWDKLWPKFKRILHYETNRSGDSTQDPFYWRLSPPAKQSRRLPESFSRDLFHAMAERFAPNYFASSSSSSRPYKFVADEIVDKLSSISGFERRQRMSFAATGKDDDDFGEEHFLGKKRKKDNETSSTDDLYDNTAQIAPYLERIEISRAECFERILEQVKALFREKLSSEERSMAKIVCALNRVADALNNVAATLGANKVLSDPMQKG